MKTLHFNPKPLLAIFSIYALTACEPCPEGQLRLLAVAEQEVTVPDVDNTPPRINRIVIFQPVNNCIKAIADFAHSDFPTCDEYGSNEAYPIVHVNGLNHGEEYNFHVEIENPEGLEIVAFGVPPGFTEIELADREKYDFQARQFFTGDLYKRGTISESGLALNRVAIRGSFIYRSSSPGRPDDFFMFMCDIASPNSRYSERESCNTISMIKVNLED